ncbi:hypothetical protein ACVWZ9_004385 [Pseudomonas chlororaphis]
MLTDCTMVFSSLDGLVLREISFVGDTRQFYLVAQPRSKPDVY